jgi:hypothetical protein
VDWPCQVQTNFLSENVGPRRRIISGISWVFSLVEEAIFLEHDCLPDPSFFLYCSELLMRYRNNPQIGYISGFNPLEKDFPFPYSYYYSRVASLWGWATWRRTWREYDEYLSAWPEIRKEGLLNLLFPDKKIVKYWTMVFDSMHDGTGPSTWDYQLAYTCWTRNFLNIVPRKNLIQYIGFGPQAENTVKAEPGLALKENHVTFPLQHPPAITPWPGYEIQFQKKFYAHNILRKAYRKLTM